MRFNPDEYITVAERIEKFYARHPQGRILTSIVEHDRDAGFVLARAEVYREPDDALPAATGHAYEVKSGGGPQATSYVEVCETSAVGRAIANLGFEIKRGIASREEMQKAAKGQGGKLDSDILAAGDILGKTDDDLTQAVVRKFGGTDLWRERPHDQKDWLLSFLNKKVNEKAAEAR